MFYDMFVAGVCVRVLGWVGGTWGSQLIDKALKLHVLRHEYIQQADPPPPQNI